MTGLANFLHDVEGWTVCVPLLPGHGRALDAFDRVAADAWIASADSAYRALRRDYSTVVLIGHSMGGALATIVAAGADAPPALVLLSPYLTPPASALRLAPVADVVAAFIPYLAGGDITASIFDPAARAVTVGYVATPAQRVRDLVSVANDARNAAGGLVTPTLIVHSRTDYRIPLALAETHRALFANATPCEQQWVEGCGHVITVDYCREQVWRSTADWIHRFAGKPT